MVDEKFSVFRRIDNVVRGLANGLTFGLADKVAAVGDSLVNGKALAENVQAEADWTVEAAKDPAYHAGVVTGAVAPLLTPGGSVVRAAGMVEAMETAERLNEAAMARLGGLAPFKAMSEEIAREARREGARVEEAMARWKAKSLTPTVEETRALDVKAGLGSGLAAEIGVAAADKDKNGRGR